MTVVAPPTAADGAALAVAVVLTGGGAIGATKLAEATAIDAAVAVALRGDDSAALLELERAGDDVTGALGPRRTPASRGHAMPTAKPMTAIAPTRIQEGWSAPADGI